MGAAATDDSTATEGAATFTAFLESNGKTATGIEVPAAVVARLGHGKRPPVRVTIGGHSYPSTLAVMGGRFLVGVSAENRRAAGVEAGDEVVVRLELDTAPRHVHVPADLAAALADDDVARRRFEALSASRRRWHVLSVGGAKTADTRRRRIERSLDLLKDLGAA